MPMNLRKKFISVAAALLAVVALSTEAAAAFSSTLLNNPTYSQTTDGIVYKEQTVSEGGTQKLFYGEYNTTASNAKYEWVIHSIRDGSDTT